MNRRDFGMGCAAAAVVAAIPSIPRLYVFGERTYEEDVGYGWSRYVIRYNKLPPRLYIGKGASASYLDTDGFYKNTPYTFSYYQHPRFGRRNVTLVRM